MYWVLFKNRVVEEVWERKKKKKKKNRVVPKAPFLPTLW